MSEYRKPIIQPGRLGPVTSHNPHPEEMMGVETHRNNRREAYSDENSTFDRGHVLNKQLSEEHANVSRRQNQSPWTGGDYTEIKPQMDLHNSTKSAWDRSDSPDSQTDSWVVLQSHGSELIKTETGNQAKEIHDNMKATTPPSRIAAHFSNASTEGQYAAADELLAMSSSTMPLSNSRTQTVCDNAMYQQQKAPHMAESKSTAHITAGDLSSGNTNTMSSSRSTEERIVPAMSLSASSKEELNPAMSSAPGSQSMFRGEYPTNPPTTDMREKNKSIISPSKLEAAMRDSSGTGEDNVSDLPTGGQKAPPTSPSRSETQRMGGGALYPHALPVMSHSKLPSLANESKIDPRHTTNTVMSSSESDIGGMTPAMSSDPRSQNTLHDSGRHPGNYPPRDIRKNEKANLSPSKLRAAMEESKGKAKDNVSDQQTGDQKAPMPPSYSEAQTPGGDVLHQHRKAVISPSKQTPVMNESNSDPQQKTNTNTAMSASGSVIAEMNPEMSSDSRSRNTGYGLDKHPRTDMNGLQLDPISNPQQMLDEHPPADRNAPVSSSGAGAKHICDTNIVNMDKIKKDVLHQSNQREKEQLEATALTEGKKQDLDALPCQRGNPMVIDIQFTDPKFEEACDNLADDVENENITSMDDRYKDEVVLHATVVIRPEPWKVLQKNRNLFKSVPVNVSIKALPMFEDRRDIVGYQITGAWKDVGATTSLVAGAFRSYELEKLVAQQMQSQTSDKSLAYRRGNHLENNVYQHIGNSAQAEMMETEHFPKEKGFEAEVSIRNIPINVTPVPSYVAENKKPKSSDNYSYINENDKQNPMNQMAPNPHSSKNTTTHNGTNSLEGNPQAQALSTRESGTFKSHNDEGRENSKSSAEVNEVLKETRNPADHDKPGINTKYSSAETSFGGGSQNKRSDRRRNRTFNRYKEQETSQAIVDDRKYFFTKEDLVVQVYEGSLLNLKDIDCIVISTSPDLSPGGGVAALIKNAAGPGFAKLCANKHLKDGECIATGAGMLPYKRVLHVIVPSWEARGHQKDRLKLLGMTIRSALDVADGELMRSLALSGIGTGNQKFPKDKWVEVVVKTIQTYSIVRKSGKHSVQEIHFVDTNTELLNLLEVGLSVAFPVMKQQSYPYPEIETSPLQESPKTDSRKMPSTQQSHKLGQATEEHSLSDRELLKTFSSVRSSAYPVDFIISSTCKIVVGNTSITNFNGDAIAIADSQYVTYSGPLPVAVAIVAGKIYQEERKKLFPKSVGDVLVTRAGDLPCKLVLHVILSFTTDNYIVIKEQAKGVKAMLAKAISMNLGTIAVSPIFTGLSGITAIIGCGLLVEEIYSFLQKNPGCSLREIHLLDTDVSKLEQYTTLLSKRVHPQEVKIPIKSVNPLGAKMESPRHGQEVQEGQDETEDDKIELPFRCVISPSSSCKVALHNADITNFRGNAIAISDTKYCTGLGVLAKAVSLAAGASYIREQHKIRQAGSDEVIVTGAGDLRCEYVFHAVWSQPKPFVQGERLRSYVAEILGKADYMELKTIAISALWKEFKGLTVEEGCKVLWEEIRSFVQKTPNSSLSGIYVFDTDRNIVECFLRTIKCRQQNDEVGNSQNIEPRHELAMTLDTAGKEPWEGTRRDRKKRGRSANHGVPDSSACFACKKEDKDIKQQQCGHFVCSKCTVPHMGCKVCRDMFRDAKESKKTAPFREPDQQNDQDDCAICLEKMRNPKTLPCSHAFCTTCIEECFKHGHKVCPMCKAVCGRITGNQPKGKMLTREVPTPCAGYGQCGTIEIEYNFPHGTQKEGHPNPGQPYHGTKRTAYLPNNKEGRAILGLLRQAFDQRLIFTVGRSVTIGRDNMVTWNDIHHKTSMQGGPEKFGYPDPTYFTRVREELKDKGITEGSSEGSAL